YAIEDILFVALFFLTAVITGFFTTRLKEREKLLQKREDRTQAIYEIVREIAGAPSIQHVLSVVPQRIGALLNGQCEIIVKDPDNGLIYDEKSQIASNEKEKAVAMWVFEHGKEAGWSTDTLPSVSRIYIPIRGFKEITGILSYQPSIAQPLTIDEHNLLYT